MISDKQQLLQILRDQNKTNHKCLEILECCKHADKFMEYLIWDDSNMPQVFTDKLCTESVNILNTFFEMAS